MRSALPRSVAAFIAAVLLPLPGTAQEQGEEFPPVPAINEVLVPAGAVSGLPLVVANDNRVPAGFHRDGVREISLVVMAADFRIEGAGGPGLRVTAVAEEGGAPSVPAPLIRVEEGTRLRVRVRNDLPHRAVTVVGLHTRTEGAGGEFVLEAGESRTVEFEAGDPGTYFYAIRGLGAPPDGEDRFVLGPEGFMVGEQEQLAGAFVVDPVGGSPPDRVMVINIFSQPAGEGDDIEVLEGLTINGLSFPYTERLQLEVGRTERWRLVNASRRFHPMHLHGFYFSVLARGDMAVDTLYDDRSARSVVTEPMRGGTTMLMEWTPTREGRWIFHCHLSFHVASEIRLPGAVEADAEHAHSHMAGLVMGIDVAPGPSDLVARGEVVEVDLYAREFGDTAGYRYGFTHSPDQAADRQTESPGPLLVFNQYQPVDVTVRNHMSVPTGVHWHGLELDAWADGVPDWSASDGRMSPTIRPGEDFTYRLSLMRPGTFMYHSHLNDVFQLSGGLYGPLIVLPPGEEFDPEHDHVKIWGWNTPGPEGPGSFDLNGTQEQPEARTTVGVTHRFRLIHIAPAGQLTAWITRDGEPVSVILYAKDGADLPEHQRVSVERVPRMGVGETADFIWTPDEPGVYELRIGYGADASHPQRWVVDPAPGG